MLLAISPKCTERLSVLMALRPCQRGSSAFFVFFKVAPFRWATKQGSPFGASLSCMYFLKFKRHIFFLWAPTTQLPVLSFQLPYLMEALLSTPLVLADESCHG